MKFKETISSRLLIIAILGLILLIPTFMVEGVINGRDTNKNMAINEIAKSWSNAQTLQGPILTIPYHYDYFEFNKEGTQKKLKTKIEYLHLLPSTLNIKSTIKPQIRYRGIYEGVVYESFEKIEGSFEALDFAKLGIEREKFVFDKARLSFGISDLRGIKGGIELLFDSQRYDFNPSTDSLSIGKFLRNSISSPIRLNPETLSKFSFNLYLNGSKKLFFLPYGKLTNVAINSTWTTPKFSGDFLPDSREINEKGFSAHYKVVDLNRAYPQIFKGDEIALLFPTLEKEPNYDPYRGRYHYTKAHEQTSFGVELKIPVDYYQKSSRSINYAILFIALTFLVFFFVEIFNRKKIHPFQYILVGLSLVMFFLLLISLSEHIGFDRAYGIATVLTISSIVLYAKNIFENLRLSATLAGILTLLYGFIYILLQLEDYSLLIGTLMLFVILLIVMYISKDIDWYALDKKEELDK